MRAPLIASLLLAVMLSACSTSKDRIINKNIDQTSTLKVNPGLLGGGAASPEARPDAKPAPQ
jgi:uncharacterized lipoprotein